MTQTSFSHAKSQSYFGIAMCILALIVGAVGIATAHVQLTWLAALTGLPASLLLYMRRKRPDDLSDERR